MWAGHHPLGPMIGVDQENASVGRPLDLPRGKVLDRAKVRDNLQQNLPKLRLGPASCADEEEEKVCRRKTRSRW